VSGVRDFLELKLQRPLRTGSLGQVEVDRDDHGWFVRYDVKGNDYERGHYRNAAVAWEAIGLWAAERQGKKGIDVGTYLITAPPSFLKRRPKEAAQ